MIASPSTAAPAQWSRLWIDMSLLMTDAWTVMILRSWRMMAGGRPAVREAERLVSEKVEAGAELAGALVGGGVRSPEAAARKALSVYGKRVRGNRKRLASGIAALLPRPAPAGSASGRPRTLASG